MKVLGIETSCDETSVAIVDDAGHIHAHLVRTQLDEHQPFKGVVPEIAARAHLHILPPMIEKAMTDAQLSWADIDGIAATAGPGLIGGVIVGVMMAKAIASAHHKPFLAVNHLAAHALTTRMTHQTPFPYLLLLVSGGHCQLVIAHHIDHFEVLGTTLDDAVGEAFDKTAKLLDLPYPGGPEVEQRARRGNPARFAFPRPLIDHPKYGLNFSFSGLKTAVRETALRCSPLQATDVDDICAGFEEAVVAVFTKRCRQGLEMCAARGLPISDLVIAGGVAANQHLRQALTQVCETQGVRCVAPPLDLCTDNAAMVAWAGLEKLQRGSCDLLSFSPRPRWPLPTIEEKNV